MIHLVFCHGFGLTPFFWNRLIPQLPLTHFKIHQLDLGYFTTHQIKAFDKTPPFHPDDTWIGIGHSLGLRKLLDLNLPFNTFLGLNGFIEFIGFYPRIKQIRLRALNQLHYDLERDPIAALRRFHRDIGWTPINEHDENLVCWDSLQPERVISELTYLTTPLGAQARQHISRCPIHLFGSPEDIIVPLSLIEAHSHYYPRCIIHTIPHSQHALGWLKSEHIAHHIREIGYVL